MLEEPTLDNNLKPKYLQLAEAIILKIEKGEYQINEKIPSINQLSKELKLSRETVIKALVYLSEQGIIKSVNRHGYFVQKTNVKIGAKVFLLYDKMTVFKEVMYESFIKNIGDEGDIDIFFHHHNYEVFKSLITENINRYTHFVIVTYLNEDVTDVLSLIPEDKLIVLDCYEPSMLDHGSMVYQNFEEDIKERLYECLDQLKKYERIVLLTGRNLFHTEKLISGFKYFCDQYSINKQIIEELDANDFRKGDIYITLKHDDKDLAQVIKLAHQFEFSIGSDIGIISYNETYLKEVLEGGITVISTDFETLGRQTAQIVLDKKRKTLANPSRLILRNSL